MLSCAEIKKSVKKAIFFQELAKIFLHGIYFYEYFAILNQIFNFFNSKNKNNAKDSIQMKYSKMIKENVCYGMFWVF